MSRNIVVMPFSCIPVEQREVEMCEHKGIGHPDTVTDGMCEAASRALSIYNNWAASHQQQVQQMALFFDEA